MMVLEKGVMSATVGEGRGAFLCITQGPVHLLAQAILTPVAKLLSHLSKALCASVLLRPLEQGNCEQG